MVGCPSRLIWRLHVYYDAQGRSAGSSLLANWSEKSAKPSLSPPARFTQRNVFESERRRAELRARTAHVLPQARRRAHTRARYSSSAALPACPLPATPRARIYTRLYTGQVRETAAVVEARGGAEFGKLIESVSVLLSDHFDPG